MTENRTLTIFLLILICGCSVTHCWNWNDLDYFGIFGQDSWITNWWNGSKDSTPPPTTTEYYTTLRKHYFEGVDWTIHPVAYRDRQDCNGHYIKCVRNTALLVPVCGFNINTNHLEEYYSKCELELENCEYRVKHGKGIYGGNQWNNFIYYNGESYSCYYLDRRANSPEELYAIYFDGRDPATVIAEWQRKNYEMYSRNPYGYDEEIGLDELGLDM